MTVVIVMHSEAAIEAGASQSHIQSPEKSLESSAVYNEGMLDVVSHL